MIAFKRAGAAPRPPLFSSGATMIFFDLLGRRLGAGARPFIERMNALIHPRTVDTASFDALFASTTSALGRDPVELHSPDRELLVAAGVDWAIDRWTVDELGRVVLLLLAATYLPANQLAQLVAHCYWTGDGRQRRAVLKSLPLLPEPARFLPLAIDACAEEASVFDAIACENPYAPTYFDEDDFAALTARARTLGLDPDRIHHR